MTFRSRFGFETVGAGLLLGALLVCAPLPASAQIVFDGNILWNNGDGTLAGQYTGTAGAGVTGCPGRTALEIGTVDYIENSLVDPLLGGGLDIVHPSWRPAIGSPAFAGNAGHGKTVNVPNDGFFEPVCYVGAIGPEGTADWTQGWTYYDSTGAGRTDLHLPGMPNPRPTAILAGNFYVNRTLSADSNYVIRGTVRVKDQAKLTIPAGTVLFGERATLGTIVIERGGRIDAQGTVSSPIIMTSDDPPGTQTRGGWGGLWLLGRAVCNCANTAAGDSCVSEGGVIGQFGGNDDNDNSGIIRYVRVEYSGFPIAPDNELNSFTFDGVGRNTQIEYIQAHRGADDGVEFFGGVAQIKHIVSTDGGDDGYDWQMGFRGKAQFVLVRTLADKVGSTPGVAPDKGIEADNNEFNFDTTDGPRSNPTISNFTFIGDRRSGGTLTGCTYGIHFRRGTAGSVLNSIVYNYKLQALRIQDDATFAAACAAGFNRPGVYCNAATVSAPLAEGQVFVSRSMPNPFRSNVAITFSLPRQARVRVNVFSADGRLVQRLADRTMDAGSQTVLWEAGASIPAGLYFYTVDADGQTAQGKVLRVN